MTLQKYRGSWDYEQLYANKMENLKETDRFLQRCNLLRLNQEERDNMNRQITSTEIANVIKRTSKKQKSRTWWPHNWVLLNIQRRLNTSFSETFPENCKGWNTLKLILWSHPDTKTKIPQIKKITGQYHWWT